MNTTATTSAMPKVEPFLLEVAEIVNTTLDVDALLQRLAGIVRRVIHYDFFAVLLLNDRTEELYIRFGLGHPQDVIDRTRVPLGQGVTGRAASTREGMLIGDVTALDDYVEGASGVHSELAVP